MATLLENDIAHLSENIAQQYAIPAHYFEDQSIKRGLRNADGTGVLIGVSKVGSVQGYYMMDGERVPMPGKLYYRGISVEDIVAAHQQSGTFGYEEVAYLLLLGSLPTQAQQKRFNDVMARARSMPAGFTEDMILKAPSRNIMNQLARSVLALYSYDDRADDTTLENVLRQSIGLIARFPLIAANAFAAKRHYFDPKRPVSDMVFLNSWGETQGVDEHIGFYDDMLWEALYAATQSPSYLNRQPYGFVIHEGQITLVKAPDSYTDEIDAKLGLGIVLLHFSSTASQWAGKIKWSFGADAAKLQLPEGYETVASCKV